MLWTGGRVLSRVEGSSREGKGNSIGTRKGQFRAGVARTVVARLRVCGLRTWLCSGAAQAFGDLCAGSLEFVVSRCRPHRLQSPVPQTTSWWSPPHPHPQAPGPESCQGAELGGSLALLPGDSAGVRGLQGEYLGGFSPSAHVDPALGAPHAPCPSPCAQVTAAFPAWPSGMNMCLFPGELERWVYRGSPYTAAEVRGPVHTWPGEVAAGLSAHRLAQLVLVGP